MNWASDRVSPVGKPNPSERIEAADLAPVLTAAA